MKRASSSPPAAIAASSSCTNFARPSGSDASVCSAAGTPSSACGTSSANARSGSYASTTAYSSSRFRYSSISIARHSDFASAGAAEASPHDLERPVAKVRVDASHLDLVLEDLLHDVERTFPLDRHECLQASKIALLVTRLEALADRLRDHGSRAGVDRREHLVATSHVTEGSSNLGRCHGARLADDRNTDRARGCPSRNANLRSRGTRDPRHGDSSCRSRADPGHRRRR